MISRLPPEQPSDDGPSSGSSANATQVLRFSRSAHECLGELLPLTGPRPADRVSARFYSVMCAAAQSRKSILKAGRDRRNVVPAVSRFKPLAQKFFGVGTREP
jgi:hypothetical protein